MYPGTFARTDPDRPAIVMDGTGTAVSYGELDDRSRRLAVALAEHGLRPGDHIAIVLDNHPRYLEIVWAALRSGLYYTPINWHLTAPEVAYIVDDCGARVVFGSGQLADRLDGTAPELGVMVDGALPGWVALDELLAEAGDRPLADEPEGAGMFYSSGTTGRPKGILFPLPDRKVYDTNPMILPVPPTMA